LLLNPAKISKILLLFFRKKKKEKKYQDLGVGKSLIEFAKIPMPESLKIFINFLKNKHGYFENFWQDLTANPNGVPVIETF
jgi:hypothetical protein